MQPTVLLVTFSSALDAASAQDVQNFVIVSPAGRRIAIDSAVYNASTDSVTLQPSTRINLHHNYQFTILGTGQNGIAGADGALLDGAHDGDAGSNFVSTLNWKNLVLTPRLSRELHAQSHGKPAGALVHQFVSRKH